MTTDEIKNRDIKKYHTHKNQNQLEEIISIRENPYIHGPTGSGKSHAVKLAAERLGLKFYKKLVGNQTTETSLLGYMDASGNYVEGIAYKPFVEGGVLLIDEIDNGNPNTNLVLNGLSDRSIAFPCGMREAHKDFVLVATANTIGTGANITYCGRNRLDSALLNRFIFVNWPYDEELEKTIALDVFLQHLNRNLNAETLDKATNSFTKMFEDILRLRMAIEKFGINHIISPRSTIQAAKIFSLVYNNNNNQDFTRIATLIFHNVLMKGLDEDTKKKIFVESKIIFAFQQEEAKLKEKINTKELYPKDLIKHYICLVYKELGNEALVKSVNRITKAQFTNIEITDKEIAELLKHKQFDCPI